MSVSTNLFSNDNPTDFTVVFNQVDNYQYNITTGNTVDLITITVPSGTPPKLISLSMPCSWRTDLTKNLTGNITLNYGYAQNGILQTRWQVYKNGVLDSELAVSNDANTNTQNLVIAFTQGIGTPNTNATIFAFMGNLSGSFTTDYDDAVSNTYVVKLTWVSTTTTQSATGGGTNTFSQSLSLNTTRNFTFISANTIQELNRFDITTANNPIGIILDKFVKGDNTPQVGTTTLDNLIVNEIRSNVNEIEGFNGINNPFSSNPTDPINMTGSAVISNTIKSPSFYSSPTSYDYSYVYTSNIETASVNNGNGTISRNTTNSRNTSVLLQTVNIPQYYQNNSFTFDNPLTLIASMTSTTALNQAPTPLNTHTFNWTSSTITIFKNDILWKTTALTPPTGGISTVITTISGTQLASSTITVSYTVYIGNFFGSWTPDFNYTTTDDVYTVFINPNMTFTNSQNASTVSGTFTLGINNSQSTRTYTTTGSTPWVVNLSNYGTNYSTRTFTENIFEVYAPSGFTIVDELDANSIKTTTSLTTTATITTGNITTSNINTVNATTVNSTNINNSNIVASKWFAINYSPTAPTFTDPDYIGYNIVSSVSAGFAISNTTVRNATSMSIPPGIWLITLSGELNVNANFSQDYFKIGVSDVSATFGTGNRSDFHLKNSSQNLRYSQTYVIYNSQQQTYYYLVFGGNNQEINNGLMVCYRIA